MRHMILLLPLIDRLVVGGPSDGSVTVSEEGGKTLASRTWRSLTIGSDSGSGLVFGSSSKTPTLSFDLTPEQTLAMADRPPTVKIVVAIEQDD
jgi:hypothetical protein